MFGHRGGQDAWLFIQRGGRWWAAWVVGVLAVAILQQLAIYGLNELSTVGEPRRAVVASVATGLMAVGLIAAALRPMMQADLLSDLPIGEPARSRHVDAWSRAEVVFGLVLWALAFLVGTLAL